MNVPAVGSDRCELVIAGLSAVKAKVYVDSALVYAADALDAGQPLCVRFEAPAGRHELRILVKADENNPCGIRGGVTLKKE